MRKKKGFVKKFRSKFFDIAVCCTAAAITVNTVLLIAGFVFDSTEKKPAVPAFLCIVLLLNLFCFVLILAMRHAFSEKLRTRLADPVEKIQSELEKLLKGEFAKPKPQEFHSELEGVYQAIETIHLRLEEYNEHQRQASESKYIYISGLMHDIATPITRINGCASMISDGMVTDLNDIKKFTSMIVQNTEDITIMLKNLAEIEKYNKTVIHDHMLPINMSSLIGRYMRFLSLELAKQNVKISFFDKSTVAPVCFIDVKSCKRVLMNLINNSIKYKNPDADCEIVISLYTNTKGSVLFELADNGTGIEEGTCDKLFEMFYRGDSARHNVSDGNGVGLFVSSEIVKSFNGKIWAENNGNGLSVFISLPLTDEPAVEWF